MPEGMFEEIKKQFSLETVATDKQYKDRLYYCISNLLGVEDLRIEITNIVDTTNIVDYIDNNTGIFNNFNIDSILNIGGIVTRRKVYFKELLCNTVLFNLSDLDTRLPSVFVIVSKSDSKSIGIYSYRLDSEEYFIVYKYLIFLEKEIEQNQYQPMILGRNIYRHIQGKVKFKDEDKDRYWGNLSFEMPERNIEELKKEFNITSYEDTINIKISLDTTPLEIRELRLFFNDIFNR